jgi:DNA-directed RNA polymerase specialized sigma subunit
MSGKEYCSQIKKINTQIKNKNFELKELRESGLPLGPTLEAISKLDFEKRKIIRTIEKLPEAEYDVLHKVYVQHLTLQEVAAERDISYSLAATIHGRALKRLENIINESKE